MEHSWEPEPELEPLHSVWQPDESHTSWQSEPEPGSPPPPEPQASEHVCVDGEQLFQQSRWATGAGQSESRVHLVAAGGSGSGTG